MKKNFRTFFEILGQNAYRYSASDEFEILLFGYSVDGGPVSVLDFTEGDTLPPEVRNALSDPSVTKWAFNTVVLGGEITTDADIDYIEIVRRVAAKLGYTVDSVINLIGRQSREINNAVISDEDIGAGDQGMMFGYATAETDSKLPFAFDLANKIIAALENDVTTNPFTVLKGDAKTQVTVDLDAEQNFDAVHSILISVCHKENVQMDTVANEVRRIITPLFGSHPLPELLINPSGVWTIGGPTADCGLTGRKIVCDQYGGFCAVGGGAFSGKDPTKVDRSASYMARYIACKLLDIHNLSWCKVQLAYAIGVAEPVFRLRDLRQPAPRSFQVCPRAL